jgi:hypothetical protein
MSAYSSTLKPGDSYANKIYLILCNLSIKVKFWIFSLLLINYAPKFEDIWGLDGRGQLHVRAALPLDEKKNSLRTR